MTDDQKVADALKFPINGADYPIPSDDSLNMDEAMIIEEYSGLALDELDEDTFLRPTVLSARMHIAYARGNPDVAKSEIRRLIGKVNTQVALEKLRAFGAAKLAEADAGPPAEPQKSEPEQAASSERPSGWNASSGEGSTNGSAAPETVPSPTGTPVSATSAT